MWLVACPQRSQYSIIHSDCRCTILFYNWPQNIDSKNKDHSLLKDALNSNDGCDAFLVMRSAYYDRTCLSSADILISVWQDFF